MFTVLDLDDTRFLPVLSRSEPREERCRNTPTDIIREYLEADILDPVSHAAATCGSRAPWHRAVTRMTGRHHEPTSRSRRPPAQEVFDRSQRWPDAAAERGFVEVEGCRLGQLWQSAEQG